MYKSMAQIIHLAESTGIPVWKLVQQEDCREEAISEEESYVRMKQMYLRMKASDENYNPEARSASGLVGGEAEKYRRYRAGGASMVDAFTGAVIEKALRVAAANACMGVIVAAPTAGSCGVLPAVLLAAQEHFHYADEAVIEALYTAGGIGGVIAQRASISGAAGGCQAEIGSASAMAAGALTALRGGTPQQIGDAAALAMKGLMGLVCDPVCGLVEVPCVKRNVIGAVNALSSAEMALAGIASRIPVDQVFDAMGAVGARMPAEVRETALGGLAATPAAKDIAARLAIHPKEEN